MNIQQIREGTADKEDSRQANSDPGNEESQSTRPHSLHTETSEQNEDLAQRNQDNNEELRGFSTDQAAAETLMQLQSRSAPSLSYDSAVVWRTTEDHLSPSAHQEYPNLTRSSRTRSREPVIYGPSRNAKAPNDIDDFRNAVVYSEANVQNTMIGLNNAINSIQHQQVNMQRQQTDMHLKQETITSALNNVMLMLQELTKSNQNSTQNNSVSIAQIGTVPSQGDYISPDAGSARSRPIDLYNAEGAQRSSRHDVNSLGEATYLYNDAVSNTACTSHSADREPHANAPMYTAPGLLEPQQMNTRYDTRRYAQCEEAEYQRYTRCLPYTEPSQYQPGERASERPSYRRSQSSWESSDAKLPPFNGKEDWKVWINRFEAVAERRRWNKEAKLDNLLPRLQGKAGDFVFT